MILESATTCTAESPVDTLNQFRTPSYDREPTILSNIYDEELNIVTWKRELPQSLKESVKDFLSDKPNFQTVMALSPQEAFSKLNDAFGSPNYSELSENIAELIDMFCYLFEQSHAGLRIRALDKAMCPKFHVDRVLCRLVTTYQGKATEWLPNQAINRAILNDRSLNESEFETQLYQSPDDIQRLNPGDVALLKGEAWQGNENGGLVHRSPALSGDEKRLLVTLDFVD